MKKFLFAVLLTAVLIGILGFTLKVQKAKTSGTIYIRANGAVEGTDRIVSNDNITYTFTQNISDCIVVERDNIVVDGAGHTLQPTGGGNGIELSDRTNVTITNVKIRAFYNGIYLGGSSNNTIIGNYITESNGRGICLDESSNYNRIYDNVFVNSGLIVLLSYGNLVENNIVNGKPLVYLEDVSNYAVNDAGQVILVNCDKMQIENLSLTNTVYGLELWHTTNSRIVNNTIADNIEVGIYLDEYSNYNYIYGNNMTGNTHGIMGASSSNNSIIMNNFMNNNEGIWLYVSSNNNSIYGNNIVGSEHGIYLKNSSDNSIFGNNITSSKWDGIHVGFYNVKNRVYGNNITSNQCGIRLLGWISDPYTECSQDNIFYENNIANNSEVGVELIGGSRNNVFYHNNFLNNTVQSDPEYPSDNIWDDGYPSGGNYWSNYSGTDLFRGVYQNMTGSDGIGDTYYFIESDNKDYYPLMGPFLDFNATSELPVQTICNSSITDFHFNGTAISFNVTGENGTAGFCRICIPKALITDTYKVFVNGTEVSYNLLPCSNSTHSYLYFNYTHSTQKVTIVPEFPSFLILPLLIIVTLPVVIVYRRKYPI